MSRSQFSGVGIGTVTVALIPIQSDPVRSQSCKGPGPLFSEPVPVSGSGTEFIPEFISISALNTISYGIQEKIGDGSGKVGAGAKTVRTGPRLSEPDPVA